MMKPVFDRLGIADDERTYAVSFYQSARCHIAAGYPCSDVAPDAWAEETLVRA